MHKKLEMNNQLKLLEKECWWQSQIQNEFETYSRQVFSAALGHAKLFSVMELHSYFYLKNNFV